MKFVVLALVSFCAIGFAEAPAPAPADSHRADQAQAKPANGEKQAHPAPEKEEEAFITKSGKRLHVTGTPDKRSEEVTTALKEYVKSKNKNFETLSEDEKAALIMSMVKETKLSVNVYAALFGDAMFARSLLSDKKFIDSKEPKEKERLLKMKAMSKQLMKDIATKLDLPDTDWNYEDKPSKAAQELGDAIGNALGKAIADGIEKAFTPKKEEKPMPKDPTPAQK